MKRQLTISQSNSLPREGCGWMSAKAGRGLVRYACSLNPSLHPPHPRAAAVLAEEQGGNRTTLRSSGCEVAGRGLYANPWRLNPSLHHNVIKLRNWGNNLPVIYRFITCRAPFTHPVFASLDHPLSPLRGIEGSCVFLNDIALPNAVKHPFPCLSIAKYVI